MKRHLTVGELRRLLITSIEPCDIPDDAPVVLPGPDHSFTFLGAPQIEEADGDSEGYYEPNAIGEGKCKVLVLRRGLPYL